MDKWIIVYTKRGVIHVHTSRFDRAPDARWAAHELQRDGVAVRAWVQILPT